MTWVPVCDVATLTPNRGAAALVGGRQVALFLLGPGADLVAIDNVDPFSGAAVLSRGIVGSVEETVTVASPVYKQRFDVRSGRCVDDAEVAVATFPVRVVDGRVEVDVT